MNKINFVGGDKLLPVFKHGFLRSEESVFPAIFSTHKMCVGKYFPLQFSIFLYGWYYYHTCRQMLLPYFTKHTLFCGRCYCLGRFYWHVLCVVSFIEADVFTSLLNVYLV